MTPAGVPGFMSVVRVEEAVDRVAIGKIVCDPVDYEQAVERIRGFVRSERPHLVLTPNLTQLRQASRMPEVASAYRSASMSTPDGWPIAALVGRLARRRGQRRVTGSDLTPLLCREQFRIGLIGGRGDSAIRAAERLRGVNRDLDVALIELARPEEVDGPASREALLQRIVDADLDLIFLGVGVPKQERLALELMPRLDHGVVLCVGATIDFLAGAVRRSPMWVQNANLEWAYRIALEPRRLVGRYAVALPYFLWEATRSMLRAQVGRRRAWAADA